MSRLGQLAAPLALAAALLLGSAPALAAPPPATKPPRAAPAAQAPLGWIRNLQRDLGRLHFYKGPANGLYTAATKAAVVAFQKAAHLTPDGLWGAKSQTALDRMLHRKPTVPRPATPLGWIRNLQRDLGKLHFYKGPANGLYTPATKAAVVAFQKAAHLTPDGLWGAKSQTALDRMLHRHG